MFNKYDIKAHLNISDKVQEARLLLSSSSKPETVWKRQQSNVVKNTKEELGEMATKAILKNL
ncbi:28057_t:CDS:2, partial [Dentiscutata erythropus]